MREWGWTLEDVMSYLATKNINVPDRTDCAWCFWQRIGEWYLLWRDNPDEYAAAEEMEEWVIEQRGAIRTFRSPQRDSWPARLSELRAEFEAGRVPERSLKLMDKKRQLGSCRVCTL